MVNALYISAYCQTTALSVQKFRQKFDTHNFMHRDGQWNLDAGPWLGHNPDGLGWAVADRPEST